MVQPEDRPPAKCLVNEAKTKVSLEFIMEIEELKTGVAVVPNLFSLKPPLLVSPGI